MSADVLYLVRRPGPAAPRITPDWYRDHRNLALLLRYIEHECPDVQDPASYIVERPWKYTPEYREALAWQRRTDAGDGAA